MGLMRRFSLKQTYLLKVIGRMLPKMTARERGRVPDTTKRIAFLLSPHMLTFFNYIFPFILNHLPAEYQFQRYEYIKHPTFL